MKKLTKDGQSYYDEPVYAIPKRETRDLIRDAVESAFGGPGYRPRKPIVVGHERVRLRWMKPDGKGGLVPR
jgi:hypothetical protein